MLRTRGRRFPDIDVTLMAEFRWTEDRLRPCVNRYPRSWRINGGTDLGKRFSERSAAFAFVCPAAVMSQNSRMNTRFAKRCRLRHLAGIVYIASSLLYLGWRLTISNGVTRDSCRYFE